MTRPRPVSYTHLDVYKRQVLGFPSGDFREQEFTDEKQIQEFCTLTYGVKFPMFEKVHVSGKDATDLYKAVSYTHLDVYKRQFSNSTGMANVATKAT